MFARLICPNRLPGGPSATGALTAQQRGPRVARSRLCETQTNPKADYYRHNLRIYFVYACVDSKSPCYCFPCCNIIYSFQVRRLLTCTWIVRRLAIAVLYLPLLTRRSTTCRPPSRSPPRTPARIRIVDCYLLVAVLHILHPLISSHR